MKHLFPDGPLERDPEKWIPVFGKRSCSNNKLERDDDSKRSHHALGAFSHRSAGHAGSSRRCVVYRQSRQECPRQQCREFLHEAAENVCRISLGWAISIACLRFRFGGQRPCNQARKCKSGFPGRRRKQPGERRLDLELCRRSGVDFALLMH